MNKREAAEEMREFSDMQQMLVNCIDYTSEDLDNVYWIWTIGFRDRYRSHLESTEHIEKDCNSLTCMGIPVALVDDSQLPCECMLVSEVI